MPGAPHMHELRRDDQAEVSTRLAEQALDAQRELLRGLDLPDAVARDAARVHEGLLTTIVCLVFLLHAEARDLVPGAPVTGLFERLHEEARRDEEGLARRFGAWDELLAVFARVSASRGGSLFDPRAHPFLDRRARISDATVERVLRSLVMLDNERLCYRSLDVEHLGSLYASMLGYSVRRMEGPSVAVGKRRVVIDLAELLAREPRSRGAWLERQAEVRVSGKTRGVLARARTPEDVAEALKRRIAPRTPTIAAAGSLVLQPGEARRRTGSHYTPRSLTEPIVRAALRPVLEQLGPTPTPDQILALKVCDPAMGSGAFLLEACRQLAQALVEACEAHPAGAREIEHKRHARRLVAERCLYGVDKNPMAVRLARLSLWLVARAEDRPFTFLDRALGCGDALVGLTRRQIAAFDWRPAGPDAPAFEGSLADARLRGDAVIAAFFSGSTQKARARRRDRLRTLAPAELAEAARELREERGVAPFHWELEFPEVFGRGFDCFVGNPPFFWGNRISRFLGDAYRDWLLATFARANGNADLAAYFLRACHERTRPGGTLGLVTTNSIAEADTRAVGLDPILDAGATIYAAWRDRDWPGAANVRVAYVFVQTGAHAGARVLDGRRVDSIGADLRAQTATWKPVRLGARRGQSFKGVDFGGKGFLLSPQQRDAIVRESPDEAAFIWPVLNASTFNASPTQRSARSIINFTGMTCAEAERRAPACMKVVRALVLPKRRQDKRKANRERWWLYNETRPGLYAAIAGLPRVLVGPVVSKYVSFAFVDPRVVFTNALNVFAFTSMSALCVLQSRVHERWALTHSSSLRTDPRYNPTDCFETFPFPEDWLARAALEAAGQAYHDCRAAIMRSKGEGLTKTYNRFHDPDEGGPAIVELRERHAAMDRAVLEAYGWPDLARRATCEFGRGTGRYTWCEALHAEVLERLLGLNETRSKSHA